MDTPFPGQKIIDSRDVIRAIEELQDYIKEIEKLEEDLPTEEKTCLDDEEEELNTLQLLADEASDSYGWGEGITLILDSYFVEFIEEECKDLGFISKDFPWWIAVDWDATAENVKMDYTEVTFGGYLYYMREC